MVFLYKFHRNGRLAKGVNSTFIVLIPKVENMQGLANFCPISFVGCLYNVLVKVLAKRLCKVTCSVISESHSAFIKGR